DHADLHPCRFGEAGRAGERAASACARSPGRLAAVPMQSYLEFEKPVAQLDKRIAELRAASEGDDVDISGEIARLEAKSAELLASTYKALTPWQKTQVARHPARPHFRDYVAHAFDEFVPLGGD